LSAPVVDRIREGIEEKRSRLSEWLEAANPERRAQALGPMAESAVQAHLTQLRDLERELQLAQGVQRELLPQEVPEVPGLQIAAYSRPAQIVSGDFFDFYRFEDGRTGEVVADVAGHGLSASLHMAGPQSLLRAGAPV